jgi:tol-pal system protein YbgF
MKPARSWGAWALLALALAAAPAAHAGLFDDDEARRAILELRERLAKSEDQQRRQASEQAQQVEQLRRSILELNNQIEALRTELAKLRGNDEQIARDVAELQRRQKDLVQGVDDRIRKIEPQKVTVDGREFAADPEEKRQFDDSLALLRASDFNGAANAFSAFLRRWPSGGYAHTARFWLGNAQYGKREYKEAQATFRTLLAEAPDHPRAPEAMLAIANCQVELRDTRSARKTLEDVTKTYPKSEAAIVAKERLGALR